MTDRVRWGILGTAKINERLLPAFARAGNLSLQAIASRDAARARTAADACGIPRSFGSYEDLLADPALDAVYIPLPNHLHDEWARKAAQAGKHVLCEKPLTPDAQGAAHLVAFARSKGIKLMDGFMWPHHPRTSLLRSFLDRGEIGPVRHVAGSFTFRLELDPKNIRLQPTMGGGSLLDVGCYPIYGIRWAMQAEPVRVQAHAATEYGVDMFMTGTLWFGEGRTAMFDCGFVHPIRQHLEIVGTTGSVFVRDMWLPPRQAIFEVRREGQAETERHGVEGADQIVHMLENFSRCILEDQPVRPPIEEAVRTLRVLDALALSAKEKRIVEL